jgi:hypothetical protein
VNAVIKLFSAEGLNCLINQAIISFWTVVHFNEGITLMA